MRSGSYTITSVPETIVYVPVALGGRDGWPTGLDGGIGLPVGLDGSDRLPDGGAVGLLLSAMMKAVSTPEAW